MEFYEAWKAGGCTFCVCLYEREWVPIASMLSWYVGSEIDSFSISGFLAGVVGVYKRQLQKEKLEINKNEESKEATERVSVSSGMKWSEEKAIVWGALRGLSEIQTFAVYIFQFFQRTSRTRCYKRSRENLCCCCNAPFSVPTYTFGYGYLLLPARLVRRHISGTLWITDVLPLDKLTTLNDQVCWENYGSSGWLTI